MRRRRPPCPVGSTGHRVDGRPCARKFQGPIDRMRNTCALPSCGKVKQPCEGPRFKACGACDGVRRAKAYYCCAEHQAEDWGRHFHKSHEVREAGSGSEEEWESGSGSEEEAAEEGIGDEEEVEETGVDEKGTEG